MKNKIFYNENKLIPQKKTKISLQNLLLFSWGDLQSKTFTYLQRNIM